MNNFPFPIYDAHHHFWDLEAVHYPWLASKGVKRFFGDPAPIQKNYLPDDLRADIGQLPVQGSVHIQVGAIEGQHLLESQTVQSLADNSDLAQAIVAFCALENPGRTQMLDELCKLNNFRGVRQIVGRSPEEDRETGTDSLLNDPQWVEGLRELEKRSLSFDLQLIPDQMQRISEIFSLVPDLKVVLCHCGSPWYREPQGWQVWKNGLKAIAELPNAHCKISGLGMFDHNWTIDSISPVIDTVLKTFGPDRCMFGSNFPVDKLHTDYSQLWLSFLDIINNYRPAFENRQIEAMFKDNCRTFYRI